MKIIIDVMSGDNAPAALLQGAVEAAAAYPDTDIAVVGNEEVIRRTADELHLDPACVEIIPSVSVIGMEDNPVSVIREKSDSSMVIGLRMLAQGEGDAFVSAGNTGALLSGGTLITHRIRGIQRAAIATVLPLQKPVLLIDSGANLQTTPEQLVQFAYMGAQYAKYLMGIENPSVGMLNNGTEPTKGQEFQVAAYPMLEACDFHFVGNVEAKEVPFGACDVLVTDGYTGNILLKYTEGMGRFMLGTLKGLFRRNLLTKLSAMLMRKNLYAVKDRFDVSEYGGAPLLGLSKPVIKAHGSSDAKAIRNAVRQAIRFAEADLNGIIARFASGTAADKPAGV